MPFFNYELSEPDKKRFPEAFAQGGWMELEFPLVCDGFECAAKVNLVLRAHQIDPETERDKLLPELWDLRYSSVEVQIAVNGAGISLDAELDVEEEADFSSGVEAPLDHWAMRLLREGMAVAVAKLAAEPAFVEMVKSKEMAHEMRVSIDASAGAPARRSRSL